MNKHKLYRTHLTPSSNKNQSSNNERLTNNFNFCNSNILSKNKILLEKSSIINLESCYQTTSTNLKCGNYKYIFIYIYLSKKRIFFTHCTPQIFPNFIQLKDMT